MKPQLALHLHTELNKQKPKCLGHEYAIFEKYDGWYGYLRSGDVIRSRAGRAIPSLSHLSDELTDAFEGTLIFEILLRNTTDFSQLNGRLNRSKGNCIAEDAYLIAHDFLVPKNFQHVEFKDRLPMLVNAVYKIGSPELKCAPMLNTSSSVEVWKEEANTVWQRDGEGVILKRLTAPYSEGKRNYDILKIKEEVTLELLVIGMKPGDGKYRDTLGTLIVTDRFNNHHPISGMTDEQRDIWWYNHRLILGKVVEVKAMKILPDGGLREPRFKAIRYDKSPSEID